MKFRFWGCRGSIASPGPDTARYGGNTTCIEVRTDAGELIILDAGTGIFPLSQALPKSPVDAHIFNTHSHWDHIQGLPFFQPIFFPGNRVRVYGAHDPVTGTGIERIVAVQLQYSYFPVREAEVRSGFEYVTLAASRPIQVGSATVTPTLLNHPVVNFGYRIDCDGKSLFFTGDHEPHYNLYEPGEDGYREYQAIVDQKEAEIVEAVRGVDALITDASFTGEEARRFRGWGHGNYPGSIELARKAGAKALYCTHHEATRSDAELERVFAEAVAASGAAPRDPAVYLAYEGLEVLL